MKTNLFALKTGNPVRYWGMLGLAVFWLATDCTLAQTVTPQVSTSRTETPTPGTEKAGAGILGAMDEDYRIGVSDVLEIQIEDAPELSGSYRITKTGTFLMPFLGRLTAQNKTPEELARLITDGLRERYLNDPHVKVFVKQYNSRSFFIQGAVRSPGVYQAEGKTSLLVLLTLAGGLLENHNPTAFILRPTKQSQAAEAKSETPSVKPEEAKPAEESPSATAPAINPPTAVAAPEPNAAQNEYTLLRVNINGLLLGRFEHNMYLEPGDIVHIPVSEVFFVAGEVHAPGQFLLKEGTTLRQAISLAQGTSFKADGKRGVIFRDDPSGKRKEVQVDIGAVMSGKNEDVVIEKNDIIMVPNSRMKSVTAPILSALGMNTITRFPMR